ncbi:MAG: electron transfer flavoprotein subunit alpha [Chloroflexi bacterium]|nr:MAG: electron transfer flavoprotein subunit alpha [Chloroflexota bacterium]
MNEVWIFAEQKDGKLRGVSHELATEGRRLADSLETGLAAVCLGHNVQGVDQLVALGVDRVYLLEDPVLADHNEDVYTTCLVDLVRQHSPQVLLAGATTLGRSFIPRVAARLETGLAANCTGLEIDPQTRSLLQTRPCYGGTLMATVVCPEKRPQVATVRPHVFKKGPSDASRQGEIVRVDFDSSSVTSSTRLIDVIEDMGEKVKLEEADIIVCGGRGLGSPKNFDMLSELAEVLGAALGSSRPPVDDGWVPYAYQVGQTGKTVSPKVYFACGISGAPQHLAGMQTSDIVVAINEDPKAPIFDIATYGIVGDLFKIVPLLTARLRQANA